MRYFLALLIISSSLLALQPFKDYMPEPQIPYNPLHYVCYRTMGEVTIDGKLDEASWQEAAWSEAFVDIEGDAKPKPQWTTRVKMMWDDEFFYFGAYLEEPHIWGTITTRDAVIFRDNDFEIFIDPDGDTHKYYEFEMNALNTVWDLLLVKPYRDGSKVALDYWDIRDMQTAVHLDGTLNNALDTDKGWSVEVAMPWHVLSECAEKTPPRPGEQWRVNFSRVQWETAKIGKEYQKTREPEHNWVWSPQGLINMHYPEMWGLVQFSDFTVENQIADFIPDFKDQAKWLLRQIYYKERTYFMQHGKYTDDYEKLGLTPAVPPEFEKPKIFVTPHSFEAFTFSKDGYYKVMITTDGACSVSWQRDQKKAGR
jgi:hypothetical protein